MELPFSTENLPNDIVCFFSELSVTSLLQTMGLLIAESATCEFFLKASFWVGYTCTA